MLNKGKGQHSGMREAGNLYAQDPSFRDACEAAGVATSQRQWVKWQKGRGAARMSSGTGEHQRVSWSEAVKGSLSRLEPAPDPVPQRYEPAQRMAGG